MFVFKFFTSANMICHFKHIHYVYRRKLSVLLISNPLKSLTFQPITLWFRNSTLFHIFLQIRSQHKIFISCNPCKFCFQNLGHMRGEGRTQIRECGGSDCVCLLYIVSSNCNAEKSANLLMQKCSNYFRRINQSYSNCRVCK